ncbi:hypothetical protein [Phocaeicola vulgatus]|uniref:hypothetical protein n=1 Tax=Phocaeicola vulgatus TaxID=821 RepID=UPI0011C0E059|nr:hypothetical protein [Phocaeicola vulgatus]
MIHITVTWENATTTYVSLPTLVNILENIVDAFLIQTDKRNTISVPVTAPNVNGIIGVIKFHAKSSFHK